MGAHFGSRPILRGTPIAKLVPPFSQRTAERRNHFSLPEVGGKILIVLNDRSVQDRKFGFSSRRQPPLKWEAAVVIEWCSREGPFPAKAVDDQSDAESECD